jgi:hypothetical protein
MKTEVTLIKGLFNYFPDYEVYEDANGFVIVQQITDGARKTMVLRPEAANTVAEAILGCRREESD